jgi:hypothetical protein
MYEDWWHVSYIHRRADGSLLRQGYRFPVDLAKSPDEAITVGRPLMETWCAEKGVPLDQFVARADLRTLCVADHAEQDGEE